MIFRYLVAAFFIVAGCNHFISPGKYLPFMPPYLPWHMPLILLSGFAEVARGIGILFPKIRRLAGWWLIAVLLAVFPANIHMLIHGAVIAGKPIPQWILIGRLPLQFVMIWCVWRTSIRLTSPTTGAPDSPGSP